MMYVNSKFYTPALFRSHPKRLGTWGIGLLIFIINKSRDSITIYCHWGLMFHVCDKILISAMHNNMIVVVKYRY